MVYTETKTYYVEQTHRFKTVFLEELAHEGQYMSLGHLSSLLVLSNTQVF